MAWKEMGETGGMHSRELRTRPHRTLAAGEGRGTLGSEQEAARQAGKEARGK